MHWMHCWNCLPAVISEIGELQNNQVLASLRLHLYVLVLVIATGTSLYWSPLRPCIGHRYVLVLVIASDVAFQIIS